MPVITEIQPQKNTDERVNVYLDGTFAFGASLLLVSRHGLVVGMELGDQQVEAIRQDDAADKAFEAALNFLSFRPRSRREVEQYFRRKGTDPLAAGAALDRLSRDGLIDDDQFARFWVENRQTFRPRGRRALQAELRQKGVDSDVIDAALEPLDEEQLARQAGEKRLRSFARLDEREFVQRMSAFLVRRGFGYSVAASVARSLLAERDSPDG